MRSLFFVFLKIQISMKKQLI